MNNHIVERHGINHIFPDTIPKKRNNKNVIYKVICSAVSLTVGWFFTKNKRDYLVYLTTSYYLFLSCVEFVQRCCILREEWSHINSRYDRNKFKLLKEIFSPNMCNAIILPVAGIIAIVAPPNSLDPFQYSEYGAYIFSFAAVYILSGIIKMNENGIYTALLIEELQGLDYGSGMAHSFFYGYLQLILPQGSSHEKSVKKVIEIYESNHKVDFATKKLYILIPLSAHCPNKLSDVCTKIEDGHVSEEITHDVAGVRDRVYKNTVYKLLPNENEVVYVMAEYATPLRTLSKVIAHDSDESRRYKRFKKEIVTNFYMTLEKLVRENSDCRDYCHLIYFRDIDEHGEHLQIDLCNLINDRIQYDLRHQQP